MATLTAKDTPAFYAWLEQSGVSPDDFNSGRVKDLGARLGAFIAAQPAEAEQRVSSQASGTPAFASHIAVQAELQPASA